METICNTPAEAAKKIRIELKAAFPGIKFSVRTKVYSMGNSIDVNWTNGPVTKAVSAIVKKYEYGRFDGMTDSSSVEQTMVSMPNGEVAYLGGAKHVFTNREISQEIVEQAQRDVCALNSAEFSGPQSLVLGVNAGPHWNAGQLANRVLRNADLTQGYAGLRLDKAGDSFEESIRVIAPGEVVAPAPVAPAPKAEINKGPIYPDGMTEDDVRSAESELSAPSAPSPVAFGEEVLAAALEIITHFGPAIRRMRTEARRASIAHRCYIRYPALDRELVQRAVLTVLVCELTT